LEEWVGGCGVRVRDRLVVVKEGAAVDDGRGGGMQEDGALVSGGVSGGRGMEAHAGMEEAFKSSYW
jgi:hypothetical protein